ncbi:hypothetical protein PHLGIDRAFT_123601 [Phlebiopsis gigantea 11061_1 CR5-6]|uniref:Uncharacterized protein n=1 Tax=Phlebiopsis gigantea (strain 11061_1 CR5-6) TaxID=745531 RepID=A0A0C3RP48_PHLG1|nr:hypothetical protein PHLGIDRAFT_123601 [Phlebiopsis gigantea 11061_1 CR5-6]
MFLPIPNTDPLTSLLTKYIPPERRPTRDVSGDWQHADFHTLVMTNSWRALARMARDRIVKCNPGDVSLILELWSLRLSSLARLRLFNQTAAELNNLYAVLTSGSIPAAAPPSPGARRNVGPREYLWQTLVPFELEVLHAKTRYWAGEHMAYVDELTALVTRCKRKAREAGRGRAARKNKGSEEKSERALAREARRRERERARASEREREREMWKERGSRVCLILASQLVEMKAREYIAAAHLLLPLAHQSLAPSALGEKGERITSPYILASVGRIYLQAGDLGKASSYFSEVTAHYEGIPEPRDEGLGDLVRVNNALFACAEGRWEDAEKLFVESVRQSGEAHVATNNLAVALLSQGRLKEGIYVLESALKQAPTALCVTEPFLFNLSTLYELRSNTAADKKRELLVEVAKWAGDGLRTSCLKMPT